MQTTSQTEIQTGTTDKDSSPPLQSRTAKAVADLVSGFCQSWLWSAMAMQDIRLRYRGSILGPFWLTLSTIIMIGSMGVIYPHLFNTDMTSYLPYLATGIVLWQFVQAAIIDGCQTFITAQDVILQSPMPFSVHVFRTNARNFIMLAHNFVIVPIVLVLFDKPVGWRLLELVPAFLFLAINGVWLGIFFGMTSARYRDIPPISASLLQVIFFVTPIFWMPEVLGRWQTLFELNPLFAAIDVVRAPLLNQPTAGPSWPVLIATTIIGSAGTFAFFSRFRSRIPYWI